MGLLSDRDVAKISATLHELANAALVEIARPGPPERNGDTEPVPVWAGEVPVFLGRARRAVVIDGAEVIVDTDFVRIYDAAGAPVGEYLAGPDWDGTSIVVEDQRGGGATRVRWSVRGVDWTADRTLDSTLLLLDDPTDV